VRSSTPCERNELPALAADESAVVRTEFFRTHRVSRLAVRWTVWPSGVVELGLILGSYSALALLINSFDTDLPLIDGALRRPAPWLPEGGRLRAPDRPMTSDARPRLRVGASGGASNEEDPHPSNSWPVSPRLPLTVYRS
jgi:hypothetical protein